MRHYSGLPATIVLVLAALLSLPSMATKKSHVGIASFGKYVQIPGATSVGSEACQACHSELSSNYRHAFHAQQGIECEDCHGAGSLHVDGGGDVTKIVSYNKRDARSADGACLSCHAQDASIHNWMAGRHASNNVRCIDCHQVHNRVLQAANESRLSFDTATRGALTAASVSPETNVILRPMSATNDACLKCHQAEGAQLSMPYHHPLREAKMSCVDCHDPHGGQAGNNLRAANANELCLGCHAQYRGPYAYQHPPVTENCMLCHTAHGSPNTNLLTVSEPALCLQCHAGHHNGGNLPLPDRCTNCHVSIHGTDVPTPSGGSRFVDKGPSERDLRSSSNPTALLAASHSTHFAASSTLHSVRPQVPAYAAGAVGGVLGMMSSGALPPLFGHNMQGGTSAPAGTEVGAGGSSVFSITPGAYRFVDGSGFLGRVGEYDSLQESAGTNVVTAYVLPEKHVTLVARANVLTSDDYTTASQLTVGERLQVGLAIRSFQQQQDHYPFYAFPFLDVGAIDTAADSIPPATTFAVVRRLGSANARLKVPKLPVHLFVKGNWEARSGKSQLAYLDENSVPITDATPCGNQCHFQSQFQPVNYTSRNIGGGAQIDLGQFHLTYEHTFSSFNDRLVFPTATFGGEFDPAGDPFGYSNRVGPPPGAFLPPSGPTPGLVGFGNYYINPPSPSEASTDRLGLNWTPSAGLTFNANVSYMRLRDTYTHYPQNSLGTDETLNWRPIDRLQVTADYHQQNLINNFTPYYSLYGNVSYHDHSEGIRLDYELPRGFDVEPYYRRSGITRSNAALWPQLYSVDNTDLLTVVPSSVSNTTGLALRYHDRNYWNARAGYEWTGTHEPGYLIVPKSNNRAFANVWVTPAKWLVLSNDVNVTVQNAFSAVPLLKHPPDAVPPSAPTPLTQSFGFFISGLPPTFQRRDRFYTETLSATFRPAPDWNLGLGYSYQQNNLATYMAFQNDSAIGYILDEPLVPYKQITQAYWADSSYLAQKRFGLNLRVTYNSSRSGFRPDVNAADAAKLGNACLMDPTCGTGTFDPGGLFPSALTNLTFSATQISEVIVPQWIGQGKMYYLFPRKFEGGFVFYYGSYRDYWNPNLNGVLRTATIYVGRSW